MASKLEKHREKQIKKAEKRITKTAKKALHAKKGKNLGEKKNPKNVTDVVKKQAKEQRELSKVFAPTYKIIDARNRGKK